MNTNNAARVIHSAERIQMGRNIETGAPVYELWSLSCGCRFSGDGSELRAPCALHFWDAAVHGIRLDDAAIAKATGGAP